MNKLFCTLILLLFSFASLPAVAAEDEDHGLGFWAEAGAASGKDHASWLTGYYDHSFTDSIGVYALVDIESDGYHEWYIGPKMKLAEGVEIGIATGRESIRGELKNSARRNAFVSVDTERVSAYVTYENGASGPWHKAYVLYKVTESVSAGVMNETFYGRGLRAEYNFGKATVWIAVLRNPDEHKTTTLAVINSTFW